jgi:tRNA-2-methylthio-N6-dimethylallyladenosine synthase
VLKEMRRTYNRERYMDRVALIREHVPDCAITTDIIVGFPGETEDDFLETMDVVRQARFSSAFTFQYSQRPGTPAAELDEQVPKAVVQERFERLVALANDVAWDENKNLIGTIAELLVSDPTAVGGRKDHETSRHTGRARDNRLVHFRSDAGVRPGDMVTVEITAVAPHHLISDISPMAYRRTPAGDRWEASQGRVEVRPGSVGLGMPSIGAPEPLPVPEVPACAL